MPDREQDSIVTASGAGMQEAMRAAEKKSTEECPVKMKLVAPPLYVLTTNVSLRSHAAASGLSC